MRILATSDLHGNLDGFNPKGYDTVVIAGDFAKMNGWGKWHLNDMRKWVERKFIKLMLENEDTEFVIVPGNHDLIFDPDKTGMYPEMDYSVAWPSNAHVLIDKSIEINGIKIYGTPWIPIINYKWAFESHSDKLKEKFSGIPYGLDILVTHSPPYVNSECNVDRSTQFGLSEHFGSAELSEEILRKEPRYVFCGHIHSGDHSKIEFGNSIILNVSRVNEEYDISYEPYAIEL